MREVLQAYQPSCASCCCHCVHEWGATCRSATCSPCHQCVNDVSRSFACAVQVAQQYAMYLAPAWLWILRALPTSSRAFEARFAIPIINMAQVDSSVCICNDWQCSRWHIAAQCASHTLMHRRFGDQFHSCTTNLIALSWYRANAAVMAAYLSQRMFLRYRSRHSWWYRLASGGQFGAKVQVRAFSSCVSVSHCSPQRSHRPSTLCRPSMPATPAIRCWSDGTTGSTDSLMRAFCPLPAMA